MKLVRANRQTRCPRCQSASGAACVNAQGQPLAGVHIEREGSKRKAIRAALAYYAGLGLKRTASK